MTTGAYPDGSASDPASNQRTQNLTDDPDNKAAFNPHLGKQVKAKTAASPEMQAKAVRYSHLRTDTDQLIRKLRLLEKPHSPIHTLIDSQLQAVFDNLALEIQSILAPK